MFNELIYQLNNIQLPDKNYWLNILRVKEKVYDNINNPVKRKEYIERLMAIPGIEDLLYEWLIYQENISDIEKDTQSIKEKIKKVIDSKEMISLIYLSYYLSGKRLIVRNQLVQEILLNETEKNMVEEQNIRKDFLIALIVMINNYENLIFFYALDKAESYAYKQYQLIPDTEKESEYEKTNQIINNDLKLDKLEQLEYLKKGLKLFDDMKNDDNTSSVLLIQKKTNRLRLYIRREIGTGSIYEHNRTILGDDTDIFIIDFINQGKYIYERSIGNIGSELAGYLIELLIVQKVKYEESKFQFDVKKLNGFFNTLLDKYDPEIRLRSVEIKNFALAKRPILKLKVENKKLNLADTIIDIEDRGFNILSDRENYDNIKRIDLIYRQKEIDDFNVIPLFPVIMESNKVVLQFSNKNLSSTKNDKFISHMEKKYDIYVVPG